MNTSEMENRLRLQARRHSLLKLYKEGTAEAQQLREVVNPDWVDHAQDVEDEEVLTLLTDREREELRAVEAALERLAKGQYGRCEDCGEPISHERLHALPEARHCIECGTAAEQKAS